VIRRLRRSVRSLRAERAEARRRRRVELLPDYRTFTTKNKGWGNSVSWLSSATGERAMIFGPTPRAGDVLLDGDWKYLIVAVDRMRDPDDQSFVDGRLLGGPNHELPPRASSPADDYVW
jgi:hypothetical protein